MTVGITLVGHSGGDVGIPIILTAVASGATGITLLTVGLVRRRNNLRAFADQSRPLGFLDDEAKTKLTRGNTLTGFGAGFAILGACGVAAGIAVLIDEPSLPLGLLVVIPSAGVGLAGALLLRAGRDARRSLVGLGRAESVRLGVPGISPTKTGLRVHWALAF